VRHSSLDGRRPGLRRKANRAMGTSIQVYRIRVYWDKVQVIGGKRMKGLEVTRSWGGR